MLIPGGSGIDWNLLANSVANAFGMHQQQQQQKQQQQMEQERLNQEAAISQAQIESENQRTALDSKRFNLEATRGGIDPNTMQPVNVGFSQQQMQQGMGNPDLTKRAQFYDNLAVQYALKGAYEPAQQMSTLGTKTQQEAINALNESLRFKEFAEKQLQDLAQRQHMGNQDAAAMQRVTIEAARLQNEVQRGAISAGNAANNLQLRIAELGLRKQELGLQQQRLKFDESKAKTTAAPKLDQGNVQALETMRQNASFKSLAPGLSGLLSTEISKYGIQATTSALTKIAGGAKNSAGISAEDAKTMLNALTTPP